jgi:hypothetical protein
MAILAGGQGTGAPVRRAAMAKFKIEYIGGDGPEPYLIVCHLSPSESLSISERAYLDRIEIESRLISPRALGEDGKPRFDLYVFHPMHPKDIAHFSLNMIVELTSC